MTKNGNFDKTINNLWRSRRLVDLSTKEISQTKQDLLGAGVVFLHATLEEFCREVALTRWLELEDEDLIETISKYDRLNRRNVKKKLVDLVSQRDQPIESLLYEQIELFLYREINFNTLQQVKDFFNTVDISLEKIGKNLETNDLENLKNLINKRHLIAHQAQCSDLDFDKVCEWGKSLQNFLHRVAIELKMSGAENFNRVDDENDFFSIKKMAS